MDYKALKELIKAVSESELTSFEVEQDGVVIKMGKEAKIIEPMIVESSPKVQVVTKAQEEVVCDVKEVKPQVNNAVDVKVEEDKNVEVIVSPIVGTFYAAPGPGEPNFVNVGEKVKKGDTLCIVEAMKLMNDIASEVDGTIVEILVNNEDMVEYGQPIIKIRKDL